MINLELSTKEFIALYNELTIRDRRVCDSALAQVHARMKATIAEALLACDDDEPVKLLTTRDKLQGWVEHEQTKLAELEKQNSAAKASAAKLVADAANSRVPNGVVTLEDVPADGDGIREYPRRSPPRMPRPGSFGRRRGNR
jgi:hypothetical protein